MCLDSALDLWPPGHFALEFFASRNGCSEMESSALGFFCVCRKPRNGQLPKMGSFHQSMGSNNKQYAVEVRWGIFRLTFDVFFLFLRAVVNIPIQNLIIPPWLLLHEMIISQLEFGPPVNDRDKKKSVCNGLLSPGNLDHRHLRVVPLVCDFRRRDNLLAWRELFANLYELKSRIRFRKDYNHFERIYRVYRFDWFSSIFAKHSRNNNKRKCVTKFWYLKYSRGVHLRDTPRIFFSYSNFRCRYLDKIITISRKLDTHLLIDAFWIRLCSHFARAAASDTR